MRAIQRAITKIDDEIKTLETLRDKMPEGSEAIAVMNTEIDMLKNVRGRLASLLPAEKPAKAPKAAGGGRARNRGGANSETDGEK